MNKTNKDSRNLLNPTALKAPLSWVIEKEYTKLIMLIEQSTPEQRRLKAIIGTNGIVSINDIIAYQIGWGTLLLNWYHTGLTNKKISMPGDGFTSWDYSGLAEHFYTKYAKFSSQKLDLEFKKTVEQIITITEKEYLTENLDKIGI